MRSANRKKTSAQNAQRQLTSFFQAKSKGTSGAETRQDKNQPTEGASDSVKSASNVEHHIAPVEERHPSESAPQGEVGRTSKFFNDSRPSKRAKFEVSEDFEILEEDLNPSAGRHVSPAVNGTAGRKGGSTNIPAHAEELHQRFQVQDLSQIINKLHDSRLSSAHISCGGCKLMIRDHLSLAITSTYLGIGLSDRRACHSCCCKCISN